MTTLHRINMLRIKDCSDGQLWYSGHTGQLVPHLGWTPGDGYRSREPSGYVNFVRTQDAEPTHVHIGADLLGHWPFNCAQAPARKVVQITRRSTAAKSTGKQNTQQAPGQSRAHSLAETLTSVAVGFVVSFGITAVLLPAYGHHVTTSENLGMTAVFTVASVVRAYALRRAFNWLHTRKGLA